MTPPSLAAELIALVLYGSVIVLVHELGHAAFARAGGFRVTSFGMGLGAPVWSLHLRRGLVFYLARLPLGGACTAIPVTPASRRRAWFHAGGLIAQAALAVVLLLAPDHWIVDRALRFDLLVAAWNALPLRVGQSSFDGYAILGTLLGSARGSDPVAQRHALERLEAHQARVKSPLGEVYARLCQAWIDVLVGRAPRARAYLEADVSAVTMDPWVDALHHYVLAEWHRLEGRPLAAVRAARETDAALDGAVSREGRALLALAEARALVDLDAPAQAARALARLAGITGPIGRQASAVLLAASLDGADADLEYATWRVTREIDGGWLDAADVAATLWEAADALEERGRAATATDARRAATDLATRTARIASPLDRPLLRRRIGPAAGQGAPRTDLDAGTLPSP